MNYLVSIFMTLIVGKARHPLGKHGEHICLLDTMMGVKV
jgi:hypothetical protein